MTDNEKSMIYQMYKIDNLTINDSQSTVKRIGIIIPNIVLIILILKKNFIVINNINKLINDLYGLGIRILHNVPNVASISTYFNFVILEANIFKRDVNINIFTKISK